MTRRDLFLDSRAVALVYCIVVLGFSGFARSNPHDAIQLATAVCIIWAHRVDCTTRRKMTLRLSPARLVVR